MNMKKSLIGLALLGSMGLVGTASAVDASQTFTWTGSVPAAPTSNGWVVASPTGSEIGNGILTFVADKDGKGVLKSSSDLTFNVFAEEGENTGKPDLSKPAKSYGYKMISLAVNNGGLAQEQNNEGYFAISAMNKGKEVKLVKHTAQAGAAGDTILRVVTSGTGQSNQPNAGDAVDVQAAIVIEGAVI